MSDGYRLKTKKTNKDKKKGILEHDPGLKWPV
jgi:hypothetical protein